MVSRLRTRSSRSGWALSPSLGVGVALALVLQSGTAHADARTEARVHYKKGMQEISLGHYDEGIAELERAYEILPHPNVLYNIARAKALAGDLKGAVVYFKRYLDGDPPDKAEVEKTLADLEARIVAQEAEARKAAEAAKPVPPPPDEPKPDEPVKPEPPKPVVVVPPPPPPPASNLGQARTEDVFQETVVTASKDAQSVLDAPNSTSIITEQDIRLSGITKIPELLRRLAGLDIMQVTGGQTEVSVRGFNQRLSNKVLVLVDGRSVYQDFIGATFWQSLSIGVEDVKRIEVVRGPGSALYGAVAFNGVINIITKGPEDGRGEAVGGFGTQNQTHGSVWAAGKDGGFGWKASAGYDYLPRWSREVPDGRTDARLGARDQDSAARTVRLDLRATKELPKDWKVRFGGGLSQGSLETLGVGTLYDLVLPNFVSSEATAIVSHPFFESRVFYNRFQTDTTLNAASVGQTLLPTRAEQNVLNVDALFRLPFNTGNVVHKLTFGGVYRYKNIDFTFLDARRIEHHGSFFLEEEAKIGKHFAIVADYRLDYIPYLTGFVHSPRGAILVHPTKLSTIRLSGATAFRPPTFLESYLDIPVQLPFAGASLVSQGFRSDDPTFKLKPESMFSAELGYLTQDSDLINVDVSVFYNSVSDLIQLADPRPVALGDVRRGAGRLDQETGLYPLYFGGFSNQCQRYNSVGSELGFRLFPTEGLDIYGSYSLNVVGQDESACKPGQAGPADQRTSMHKVNAGVQIRTKPGIDASMDFHLVSAQKWAERIVSSEAQSVSATLFDLSAYTLLNARLGYRFFKDHMDVSVAGFNILGTEHRQHPFGQLVGRRVMGFLTYRF